MEALVGRTYNAITRRIGYPGPVDAVANLDDGRFTVVRTALPPRL